MCESEGGSQLSVTALDFEPLYQPIIYIVALSGGQGRRGKGGRGGGG